MHLRAIALASLLVVRTANYAAVQADTVLKFPAEPIGTLYFAAPENVNSGAEATIATQTTDWQFLALAAGPVRLPEGKLVRLQLKARPAISNTDADVWIREIPNHAIHSLHASLTDKTFSAVAKWTALQELKLLECNVTSAIGGDLAKLTSLRRIELLRLPAIDDQLLTAVAELPNLQEIRIDYTPITESAMPVLARSRSLSDVTVCRVAMTDVGVAWLAKLPKLRALNLYAAEPDDPYVEYDELRENRITDSGLQHIGKCTQLTSLNIHGANVSKLGLQKLFASCPNLRNLGVSKSALDQGALEAASKLPLLEVIRVTGVDLTDPVASQLAELKALRDIEGFLVLSNDGVEKLSALSHLESLSFAGVADDQCMQALSKLRDLKTLWIQGTQITDSGLARLEGLPKLESVLLKGPGFTSGCLKSATTWPNLRELSLYELTPRADGLPEWDDIAMLPPTLRSLEFIACAAIGDKQLQALSRLPGLERLSVHNKRLRDVTDKSAEALARAPRLKSLTIKPTSFSDEGLGSLQASTSIETLDITCLASSLGLKNLSGLKSLRGLSISSPDISVEEVADFKKRHPRPVQVEYNEPYFSRAKASGLKDAFFRSGSNRERESLNALEGKIPPALSATAWTPADAAVQLDDLRGQVVLIDFWGTWCSACLGDMPRLRELHAKYHQKGLVVITIHSTEDSQDMAAYLSKSPFPWINACDTNNETASAFSVTRWPSKFLIDRQGILRIANPLPEHLEDAIQALLDE